MTDAERRLWQGLRGRQMDGFKFRRQLPLGRYIVDFVCLEAKLVIEVDGSQHLESRADRGRDAWLMSEGYRVLRFWNHDVLQQTAEVLEQIWKTLQAFTPSPLRGEGRDGGEVGAADPVSDQEKP